MRHQRAVLELDPRLHAWELREGHHVEVADVGADRVFEAIAPFPVTITTASLV